MKKVYTLILIFSCLLVSAQNDELFEQATTAYNDGKYDNAIEHYLQIIEGGEHSAALYFNLGNCYYKTNRIAPSIYYYEKALLLSPGDSEIKNNLAYAQQMTVDAIETMPETGLNKIYNSIIGQLSFDQWAYLAVVLAVVFVLCYLAYFYLRMSSQKRIALLSSITALVCACICVGFAIIQHKTYKSDQPAIVFAEECLVKSEPNNRSTEVFLLHEGTKVRVIDGLEDFKKIELADGKIGWVHEDEIKLLKDF
jgi:tetratricopeptide (TPR) repeat protein